jgi:hypothetical protein
MAGIVMSSTPYIHAKDGGRSSSVGYSWEGLLSGSRYEVVEEAAGVGNIFHGEHPVATADYRVVTRQLMVLTRAASGSARREPGLRRVDALIRVRAGRSAPIGATLTLCMDDGRMLEFVAMRPVQSDGWSEIKPIGGPRPN